MNPENPVELAQLEPAPPALVEASEGVVIPNVNLDEVFQTRPVSQGPDFKLPPPRIDDYQVQLPCFEGPLDLLLHLINKEQLNIRDIPVARVCESYLHHLELLQQLDFNIAGEFMVMASTLIYIKSQMLLPQDELQAEAEDPRAPLVAQLLEYERFKNASFQLNARSWLGREHYGRSTHALAEILPQESLLDSPMEPIEPFSLLKNFKVATDRTRRPPMEITTDPVSIKEKVSALTTMLQTSEIVEFVRLLPVHARVADVIVSFLAVLELAKLKFIEILQTENFGPIQVRGRRSTEDLNFKMLDQY